MKTYKGKEITFLAPLVKNRKGFYKDLAVWARNKGYEHLIVDGEKVSTLRFPSLSRFTEHNIDLPTGTVKVTPENEGEIKQLVAVTLDFGKGILDIEQKGKKTHLLVDLQLPELPEELP